jgi:DNA polymerase IV
MTATLCLDCAESCGDISPRCDRCGSPRIIRHSELNELSIAHIDCDAFYASVEKRDNPDLRDKPVIVGGRVRGVVSTACYVARVKGVKSAMPMFKALKLCPDAVVIRPDMKKYTTVGRQVREMMLETTPLVEPVSIDEAFLDLTGTTRLHGHCPAATLARLSLRIEEKLGITVSIGLAANKFLAKVASDLMKPRGFSVIGKGEMLAFLAQRPVSTIWGVGAAMQAKLARDGITTIGQLQALPLDVLAKRYGGMGEHMFRLSRGMDSRHVSVDHETKSVSAETTFNENIKALAELEPELWHLCERVSKRAKIQGLSGSTISLKLKSADFKTITRAASLSSPTLLAHQIYSVAHPLLVKEAGREEFRLIGVGISNLVAADDRAYTASLDSTEDSLNKAEGAVDQIRAKFGDRAIERGLGKFR